MEQDQGPAVNSLGEFYLASARKVLRYLAMNSPPFVIDGNPQPHRTQGTRRIVPDFLPVVRLLCGWVFRFDPPKNHVLR